LDPTSVQFETNTHWPKRHASQEDRYLTTFTLLLVFVTFYGIINTAGTEKEPNVPRVFLADPAVDQLTGACAYCYRTNSKKVTSSNVANETFYGAINLGADPKPSQLLTALVDTLENVMSPTIKASTQWGDMKEGDTSVKLLHTLLDNLSTSMHQGIAAVDAIVTLPGLSEAEADGLSMEAIKGPEAIKETAEHKPSVVKIELLVNRWCDQVARVLSVNEQIRSEPDDAGPGVELTHWKQRTAVFNSLSDAMKEPRSTIAITVLHQAKSKVVARWQVLDIRLTSKANESKDNVRYLNTMDEITRHVFLNLLESALVVLARDIVRSTRARTAVAVH
jgi:hypothetical protein